MGRYIHLLWLCVLVTGCGGSGGGDSDSADGNTVAAIDQIPPNVVSVSPAAGSTNNNVNPTIVVTFSEPISASSVTSATFAVAPAITGSYSVNGAELRLAPSGALTAATQYTITLEGIRDLAGNTMADSYAFSFTTAAPVYLSCAAADVLCVDDTAGGTQEYSDLPAAVAAVQPGQTVLVYDGMYTGFQITRSGNSTAPIAIRAAGTGAVIASRGPTGDGVRLENVSYVTIEGLVIQGGTAVSQPISQRCIAARGATATNPMRGNVLRGNTCTDAALECFYLSQFGSGIVENNVIMGCGRAGGTRNHGIYLANAGADNTTIRGNTITTTTTAGAESNGIHVNGDRSIGGDGIISGLTIEGNTIYGSTQSGLNMDGVQNSTVRNNLIYGNARHAVRAYRIDGAAGPQGLVVVNNTLIADTSGWAVKLSEDGGGHTFLNNILLGAAGSLCVANTNLAADRNAVNDRFSADNEASTIALAAWRTQTGQDANSVLATAATLFVDDDANDFRLATGSPAKDAGVGNFNGVSAPASDLAGTARPQGTAYDLGAFEAAASAGAVAYYLAPAPAGNDANPGTSSQPWATFRHALSRLQAGQTLIVKNGTYNQNLGEWRFSGGVMVPTSKPADGSAGAHTTIRGESVGGVAINGSLNIVGWSYATVENFTFQTGGTIDGGSRYIEVRNSGFNGGIGTANSSYIVKEDIWAWGANRYVISNFQADHVVDHRVIARLDDLGAPPPLPVGAIAQYLTDYSVIAHGLFFDVTGTFDQPYALVYSSRPTLGMNRLYGIIGFNAGPQLGGIFPGDGGGGGHEINNSVIHGTSSYGVRFNSPGPNQLLNSTIFDNVGAALNGHHNITASNNILYNNAGGISATVTSCSNNLVVASGSAGSCSGNDATTTPSILYLPRSPIAGKGANIETRYRISLVGTEFVIAPTADPLWPWPHEAVIKRDMCAGRTTGWCATTKTLTRYVWEYLGSPCPADVCP